MAERGHRVDIFGGEGPVRQEVPGGVRVLVYPYTERERFPNFGSRFRKFMERLSFAFHSFRDLRENGYDIIYVHKPFDIPAALVAARRSKTRVVFGSGGTEFFPGYRWLVKRLDHFFSCSEFNAGEIEAYSGIRPRILYNGVDTDVFRPLKPDFHLRKKLGIKEGEKVMVTVCRLIGLKGVQYALEAMALLRERIRIRYIIIGDGEYRGRLERKVSDLGLGDSVSFLGSVPNSELPAYYSIATVGVFPSIADEAFGISIAEAMSCGVPVVATDVGGIPEVVTGGGVLVKPRNPAELAEAVSKIFTDEKFRKRLSLEAKNIVEENFSWETIVSRFDEYTGTEPGSSRL